MSGAVGNPQRGSLGRASYARYWNLSSAPPSIPIVLQHKRVSPILLYFQVKMIYKGGGMSKKEKDDYASAIRRNVIESMQVGENEK